MILAVDLPALPATAVGGNRRGGWQAANRAFQDAKADAVVVIRNAINEHELAVPWQAVTVRIEWLYANAGHRPDPDNGISRAKAYLDGAVAAGLIPDDGPDVITALSIDYTRAKRAGIRLWFTEVTQEGQDAA